MLAIAGQTAGPNKLIFLGNPWVSGGQLRLYFYSPITWSTPGT